jgi:Tol biopolymer transport system component/serine/threonine protein kinase
MALSSGSRLGPYEVLAPIGAGGMGEVYRARDTRLEREVAVKVLPEAVAKDAEGRARFEREARTVAGLNDPHVCSLFDVGVEGDVHYAVLELLEGETLRDRLSRGPLSSSKTTEVATQLCQGLAAAHAKGIVHRDLKPENVFLTKKGLKILDFGLARLQAAGRSAGEASLSQEATLDAGEHLTRPGAVPGTVAYMSPEQARGGVADPRSDIFAVGVVLFETLSGKHPFRRATHPETLTAILREDPPELVSRGGPVPPGLERITRRCLEKNPVDRFQSATDLAFSRDTVSGQSSPLDPKVPTGRRWAWARFAPMIVAAAVVAGIWAAWPREPPAPLRVRPITSDPGMEDVPALSPDGNQLAFVKEHEGELALYVKLIDGGDPLLLTQSAMGTFTPAWSPDGLQIAFARHVEGEDGEPVDGVFVVPALGGPARQLATFRGHQHAFSWSPDRATLAVSDRDSADKPRAIFLFSLETGERRRLTTPPAGYLGDGYPRFSPDGRTLAFVREEAAFVTDIYVVPIAGGQVRRLTEGNHQTGGLDWTADGQSIVFSSWRTGGAGVFSLWRVAVSGGDPEPLDVGEHGDWPTVSRESGRLAYSRGVPESDIWRIGGPTASDGERSPTRLVASTSLDYHPRYSPDGRHMAFVSGRSGAGEIWICDADGSKPRQLTFLDDPMTLFPRWSPDGRQVAFTSAKEGSWDVYVVSVSGGLPNRLTTGSAREAVTGWSPDGQWVYYFSNEDGAFEIWKVPPRGGEATRVTSQGGTWAAESSGGRFLYFGRRDGGRPGRPGIWRIPTAGGEEVQILDRAGDIWWTVLEQGIVYVDFDATPPAFELFDFTRSEVSWSASIEVPFASPGISVSPDGRWVIYGGREGGPESDIMLVENFE